MGGVDGFHAQDAASALFVDFNHLPQCAFGGVDEVVGEDDGEGLVADGGAGAQDGVSQPEGFGLADVEAGDAGRQDVAHVFEQLVFVAQFEFAFEFVGFVEMVFDAAFVAAGYKHHLGAAGFHGFFHGVLDQGLVDDGQHFFGAGFGGGQKAGAHAGHGENGFSDGFRGHGLSFVWVELAA